jgi:hypothetical protein
MTTEQHVKELKEQGWTRVDTVPGEWVALVLNDDHTAYGGTLWRRGSDGFDYSEGCTAGHPVSAEYPHEMAGLRIAALIQEENAA